MLTVTNEQKCLDLRTFKNWLRQRMEEKVGSRGYGYETITPLIQFCREMNIDLQSVFRSKWANKYNKNAREYDGVPGRITGQEALCDLCRIVGWKHFSN